MNKKKIALGVFFFKQKIYLLEAGGGTKTASTGFSLSSSDDGMLFIADKKPVVFSGGLTAHKPEQTGNFRFSSIGKKHYAVYTRTVKSKSYRVIAECKSLYEWEVISEIPLKIPAESVLLPNTEISKEQIVYEGGIFIKCLIAKNWQKWDDGKSLLFTTRHDRFDKDSVGLLGAFPSDHGIAVFYESREYDRNGNYHLCIGAVIFDKEDPRKIVWRSTDPVWKSDIAFSKENTCKALGAIAKDAALYFFFDIDGSIINICIDSPDFTRRIPAQQSKLFTKHKQNPLISPDSENHWENRGSCNPATIIDDDGHVHMLYRAIGSDGISRIGYSFSRDGVNFDDKEEMPVFSMADPQRNIKKSLKKYSPVMYPSGGSWGGCEDPRAVRIDGKIYVTFNAFDNWDFIRVAVISMKEKDFLKRNWKWSNPLLLSPAKEINKNWVLFPEKIDGKFVLLHSVWPKIGVEYLDSLEELADGSKTVEKFWDIPRSHRALPDDWTIVHAGSPGEKWVHREYFENSIWNKEKNWDTWVRSAGPPPIKTDKGWLVLYHAGDERESHVGYKLGALLLDINNPEKILARSKKPLIVPEKWYENDWKPQVVYACGAVVKKGVLHVYYGGGDKHVCVAVTPLASFLKELIENK